MTDATERKRRAIKARAASSSFPAEVEACEAALARLEERQPTRNVVRVKAELHPDPFGPRQTYKRPGPPAARALLPHQRKAWLLLASGGGNLSRSENSFLHRVRESKSISAAQSRFLDDIDIRMRWEASIR